MAERSQDAQGFAKKTAISFATNVLVLFANLVAGILIARLLGTDGKGAYALITGYAIVIYSLVSISMSNSVTFHIGRYQWPAAKTYLAALLVSWGALGLFIGLARIVGAEFIMQRTLLTPETFHFLGIVVVAGLPLMLVYQIGSATLRGRELIVAMSWPTMVAYLVRLSLVAGLLLLWRRHLSSVVIAELAAWCVWALLVVAALKGALRRWPAAQGTFSLKKLVCYGFQNQCTDLLHMLFQRADLFLINYLVGQSGAGIYSLSINTSDLAVFATIAVTTVLFPRLALLEAPQRRQWAERLHRMQTFIGFASGAFIVLLTCLIPYVYGQSFAPAVVPAIIRVVGTFVWGSVQVMRHLAITEEKIYIHNIAMLTSLIGLVAMDWVLIPRLGLTGAALAYAVSIWVAYAIDAILLWRLLDLRMWTHFVATKEDVALVVASVRKMLPTRAA